MSAARKPRTLAETDAEVSDKDCLRFHPVMIELSKAKALLWLLDKYVVEGLLEEPRLYDCKMDGDSVEEWVRGVCLENLAGALAEAETEFVKTLGMGAKEAVIGKAVAS